MYVHTYVYCIYTYPLFCASHSSWWNDQGNFRELDKGMICPSSMAMMTYRNISRSYCKILEVTIWELWFQQWNIDIYIYIYIYSKYIFIIGWWSHMTTIIWVSRSSLYIIVIREYVTCVSPCSFQNTPLVQGGAQLCLLIYKPRAYYTIKLPYITVIGIIYQLSYHKSFLNPIKSTSLFFSHHCPMVFPVVKISMRISHPTASFQDDPSIKENLRCGRELKENMVPQLQIAAGRNFVTKMWTAMGKESPFIFFAKEWRNTNAKHYQIC